MRQKLEIRHFDRSQFSQKKGNARNELQEANKQDR